MDKEISLKQLLQSFWQAKFYMLGGWLVAFVLAFLFIFVSVPKYSANMIVAPADGYALGDYASAVQYDSVATLPFWRPKDQAGASTDFYRFIHTLRGPAVAGILIKDESALSGINRTLDNKIKTPEELSVYLKKHIRIDPLGATPLRRLNYAHPDAEFAAALLRKLHLVADQMIRRDRRQQSQSRIEYLENVLRRTNNPDHRKGVTNLIMQQEHIQMLANLDEPYAAIVVEPASASPKPTWPNKPLIWFVFSAIGLMFGYIIWCFRKPDGETV
ncbi:MAG TPA: Wzz/FepE/Etk N-terminal domain-containing protein [Alphaproteobacteria bacterium]|nr:Wzz/FepE/Etk N-terminal domain-containing protein [Alphaproteobacteria bacterium]